jgi:hypothetical protein
MDAGEHASLIRGAALFFSIGIAGMLLAAWLWVRGKDDGPSDREETQGSGQELVRPAGIAEVPDAGQEPRGQREGSGEADAQAREALAIELQQDRGEGEPEAGQELVEAPFLRTPAGQ